MDNVIDVCCIATPDGLAFWCQPEPEVIARFWTNWKASLPDDKRSEYEARGCLGGIVKIRMLESAYHAIPATNESHTMFERQALEKP